MGSLEATVAAVAQCLIKIYIGLGFLVLIWFAIRLGSTYWVLYLIVLYLSPLDIYYVISPSDNTPTRMLVEGEHLRRCWDQNVIMK